MLTGKIILDTSIDKILKPLLKKSNIDLDLFFNGIKDYKIKDELKNIPKKLMIKKFLEPLHLLLIIKYFGDKID